MAEVNELGRDELRQLRPSVYLRKGFDELDIGSESAGNFTTAACIVLEDAEASPQEFLTVYEAIKQCLALAENSDPNARMRQAVDEALGLTQSLLGKKLNSAIVGWIQECVPLVTSKDGLKMFMNHLKAVAEQYSLTMSFKHGR